MACNYRVPVLEYFPWQDPVKTRTLSSNPALPTRGDRYIVKPTGGGLWTGHDNDIAYYDGTNWQFTIPTEGFTTWVEDEDKNYIFDGSIWRVEVGGTYLSITTQTTNYAATLADDLIRGTGTWTLSLPGANATGKVFYIKNKGTGKITVAASGTNTIDGNSTQKILAAGSMTIVDAALGEWDII